MQAEGDFYDAGWKPNSAAPRATLPLRAPPSSSDREARAKRARRSPSTSLRIFVIRSLANKWSKPWYISLLLYFSVGYFPALEQL